MEKILSISIAAYNVANVIEECLNSFIKVKYLDLIEIIVVDDGSKDNTYNIVNKYVKMYPNSIKLISKDNAGHGSTINVGIEKAIGKYFKVVDGDDWVNSNNLDILVEKLLNLDVDLVINNYKKIYNNRIDYINICNNYICDYIYKFEELPVLKILPMHAITVKTSVLKKDLRKISEKKYYVDSEYIFFVALSSETVIFFNEDIYQYRLGQIGQSVSPQSLYKNIEDMMFIIDRLLGIYSELDREYFNNKKKKYLFSLINTFYKNMYAWFLIMPKIDKYKKLEVFDKKMKKKYLIYIKKLNLGVYRLLPLNYYILLKIARALKPIQMKIKNILLILK